MTHTDPSADAFMRRILSNPADPVPRLVFADWLEESGTSSNLAWARYLRLADELANAPADDPRRPKLEPELARIGSLIRAQLTCRAEVLVAYPDAMRQLLPMRCVVANLGTVMPPPAVVELLPESVARENQLVPLAALADGTVLVATTQTADRNLVERLEFILACPIAFVGATDADLLACLNRNYGLTETESVDSITYHWLPDDGLRDGPPEAAGDPAVAAWNQIILDARLYPIQAVQVEIDAAVTVWRCRQGEQHRDEWFTCPNEVVPRLVPMLRSFLRNVITNAAGTTWGEVTVAFWGQPRTHSVQIAARPGGHSVLISIPPYPGTEPAALNPAA